ncbi:MAG: globin domain-containing protein [Neomegalonema sp.]|nr:globin domain-containing protein [Neomegalonema sp.]
MHEAAAQSNASPRLSHMHIAAVQRSFLLIAPKVDRLVADFYQTLFKAQPHVRALFPDDLSAQQAKLVGTLSYVVSGLSNVDEIVDQIRALGVRHKSYGAEPAHYDAVGAALLMALREHLGPSWDDETEQGWGAAYQLVAAVMQEEAASN